MDYEILARLMFDRGLNSTTDRAMIIETGKRYGADQHAINEVLAYLEELELSNEQY